MLEKPLRQQLKVETNANHGLFAFFRQLEKNGEKYYETLEEAVQGKTDSSGTFQRLVQVICGSWSVLNDILIRSFVELL